MGCVSSQEGRLKDLFLENKSVELQNELPRFPLFVGQYVHLDLFSMHNSLGYYRSISEYQYRSMRNTSIHVFFYSLLSFIVCTSLGIRSFAVPRIFPYLVTVSDRIIEKQW